MHYIRSQTTFQSYRDYSDVLEEQYTICIPIKLQEEYSRKFYIRRTPQFYKIKKRYKTIRFDIPNIGNQPIAALPCLPLRIEIEDDFESDHIGDDVIRHITKFVNRLWGRYNNEEQYYNQFELTDFNESEYINNHIKNNFDY